MPASGFSGEMVRAGFDGVGHKEPDTWRGAPGDGWNSQWLIHVKKGVAEFVTGYPRLSVDRPLSEESPTYLEFALCPVANAELDSRNPPYVHTAREVDSEVIDATKPYEVRFKIRLDNRWEAWGDGQSASLTVRGGFSAWSTSWAIRATPQGGWAVFDGNVKGSEGGWRSMGLEATPGETVSGQIVVFPEPREYRVSLTVGDRTTKSDSIPLQGEAAESAALILTFAGTLGTENVRGGSFSFDEIEVEQPPSKDVGE